MNAKKRVCKAKGCRKRFVPINSFNTACSPLCAIKIVNQKKAEKAKKKRLLDKERLDAIRPRSYWLNKAQAACNRYIRERDKNEPCVSCGRYHTGQYHAGHFMARGGKPGLRFHPYNIHKQCQPCNAHLSGNLIKYRERLIYKCGSEMVHYLETSQGYSLWTVEEIKEIEQHYKDMLKQIKS